MEAMLVVLVMLVLAWCVVLVVIKRLVRAARRRTQAMRDRATIVIRSHAVGPLAEVARLRRELDRAVTGVRQALAAARAINAPVGDVPALLARLELAAHEVAGELRMLETQPDRHRVALALTGPRSRGPLASARRPAPCSMVSSQTRSRADAIVEAAGRLVDGLLDGASRAASDLALLQVECAIEADALRGDAPPQRGPSHHRTAH